MKRTLLVLAVTAALALLLRGTRLEDDPVRSLAHPDPIRAALFDHAQERGLYRDRIFVEAGALEPAQRERLEAGLREAGYQDVPLVEAPPPELVFALAPLLPAEEARRLMGVEALGKRAREAASVASLPGGDAYLRELEQDPLGLGPALLAQLAGAQAQGDAGGGVVRAYRSPRPMDYARVGREYDRLVGLGPRVHFIGADFFALENYRAASHDIVICSTLCLLLNLVVFYLFTGRWFMLGLLFLGSLVSYLTGLLAIRAFYPEVFTLVLAYTSTFVGYNNESLVHLSALEGEHRGRSLLGVWSAIGTTVIGFLVLLLGRSLMVRQMALASLGGMAGFLLFLVPYRDNLRSVRYRTFSWPKGEVSGRRVAVLCAACLVALAVIGMPPMATHIEGFRFQTPSLDAQVAYFSRRLEVAALDDVVAIPAPASPQEALAPLVAAGWVDMARHPLSRLRSRSEQEETLRVLAGYGDAVARLCALLAEGGLRLAPSPRLPPGVAPLDGWKYLELLGTLSPLRWTDTVEGRRYVMAGLTAAGGAADLGEAIPVSPRHYYDALLTSLSRELGWLFLAGLLAMAGYLIYFQRNAARVLYVLAPVFLAAVAFALYARLTGGTIHIVHIMGFSLVIALALDYTAVAVSGDHGPVELSKVLLTGLSTLATFGILILARHPVLRELGITVSIGCAVSLAFALFLRLRPAGGGSRP